MEGGRDRRESEKHRERERESDWTSREATSSSLMKSIN